MTGSGALYPWEFKLDGRAIEVRVEGPLAFNEPELMLQAALDGLGVAYVLSHEAARFITEGRLYPSPRRLVADIPGFPSLLSLPQTNAAGSGRLRSRIAGSRR